MLKQEQELRRQVVEIISMEELVPREHLLRKIDAVKRPYSFFCFPLHKAKARSPLDARSGFFDRLRRK